jgi:predicted  nucleic acid-binding Zn-ribbon protein
MSPELERLIELQRLASAIADARQTIDSHPARLQAADALLTDAAAAVDTAKAALDAVTQRRREVEKETAVFQGRLDKFQVQLSAVKTNREYQAMQTEIVSAKEEVGRSEERIIECMVELDDLSAILDEARTAHAAQQKAVTAEKQALDAELTATEATLTRTTAEHDALVAALPARVTALFDKVARIRRGVALSEATRDGLCSACHVRLRPMVFQRVRANDEIIQCDSCNRILYYVPPPPGAPAEPATASA